MSEDLNKLKLLTDKLNKIDEELAEEKEIYKFLAEISNDGYWDWHVDHTIPFGDNYEYLSPRFWEILGYLPEEKEHKLSSWFDMISDTDKNNVLNSLQKHIDSKGEYPYRERVRYTHKDGSTVWVLFKGTIVSWNEDGTHKRMVGTQTDITDIMKLKNKK